MTVATGPAEARRLYLERRLHRVRDRTNDVACVVERDDRGNLISMGEASLTAMRGYLESRRVGAC